VISYRDIITAILAASAFSVLLLFTGCSVSYPYKSGEIRLEFTPTDAMLERAGITRTLKDK
jgi:hypothetical protein